MSILDKVPAGERLNEKPWEAHVEPVAESGVEQINPFKVAVRLQSIISVFADREVAGDLFTPVVDLKFEDSEGPKRSRYQICASLSRQIGQSVYLIDREDDSTSLWFSVSGDSLIDGKGDSIEDKDDLTQLMVVLERMDAEYLRTAVETADSLDISDFVCNELGRRIDSATEHLELLESKGADFESGDLDLNNFRVKINGTTIEECVDEELSTTTLSAAVSIAVRMFKAQKGYPSAISCSVEMDLGDGVFVPIPEENIRPMFKALRA